MNEYKHEFETPGSVRVMNELTPFSRLLYAEIYEICQAIKTCNATNNELAEVFEVSKDTISRAINELRSVRLIQCEIDKDNGNIRTISLNKLFPNI